MPEHRTALPYGSAKSLPRNKLPGGRTSLFPLHSLSDPRNEMTITDCFLLPDGRLRAGWRAALFVVVFIVAFVIALFAAGFARQVPSVTLGVILQAAAAG